MEDFELFATQEEARAFVKGVEMAVNVLDSDHLVVEAPYQVGTGEWRVDYSAGC